MFTSRATAHVQAAQKVKDFFAKATWQADLCYKYKDDQHHAAIAAIVSAPEDITKRQWRHRLMLTVRVATKHASYQVDEHYMRPQKDLIPTKNLLMSLDFSELESNKTTGLPQSGQQAAEVWDRMRHSCFDAIESGFINGMEWPEILRCLQLVSEKKETSATKVKEAVDRSLDRLTDPIFGNQDQCMQADLFIYWLDYGIGERSQTFTSSSKQNIMEKFKSRAMQQDIEGLVDSIVNSYITYYKSYYPHLNKVNYAEEPLHRDPVYAALTRCLKNDEMPKRGKDSLDRFDSRIKFITDAITKGNKAYTSRDLSIINMATTGENAVMYMPLEVKGWDDPAGNMSPRQTVHPPNSSGTFPATTNREKHERQKAANKLKKEQDRLELQRFREQQRIGWLPPSPQPQSVHHLAASAAPTYAQVGASTPHVMAPPFPPPPQPPSNVSGTPSAPSSIAAIQASAPSVPVPAGRPIQSQPREGQFAPPSNNNYQSYYFEATGARPHVLPPAGSKGHPDGRNWTEEEWNMSALNVEIWQQIEASEKENKSWGTTSRNKQAFAYCRPVNSTWPPTEPNLVKLKKPQGGWPNDSCLYCFNTPKAPPGSPQAEWSHPENWKYGTGNGAHAPVACKASRRFAAEGGNPAIPECAKYVSSAVIIETAEARRELASYRSAGRGSGGRGNGYQHNGGKGGRGPN